MLRISAILVILPGLVLAAGPVGLATSSNSQQDCTVFLATSGDSVLVGNNEDYGNPVINVWFLPASEATYGRFLIGTEGVIQGGMNEYGLVYDSLTIPAVEVSADERPLYLGMWPIHALETCATVEEVVAFYEQHCFPGTWDGKVFFADAAGDAVAFEGAALVRKTGRFFVSTNFLQSQLDPAQITCDRFLTAGLMLESAETYTAECFRDILDAVHAEYHGGSGTIYSTIYDLEALTITCYLYHDYDQPVMFDLSEELAFGEHTFELREAFPGNEAYEVWRTVKIETLARQIASLRDEAAEPTAFDDVIGHYVVSGDSPILMPSLALNAVSVSCVDSRLACTVCPEGLALELFPMREDRFRAVSMNNVPTVDVEFQRDAAGCVVGATLFLGASGPGIALERVSDTPLFAPLPGFMVPFPEPASIDSRSPVSSPPWAFWVGTGLVILGLVALAVALALL